MSTTISSFTRNTFFKTVLGRSPNGLKRLVFLSSFIAYATNVHKPEKAFIRNINEILSLTLGGDSSLELPVRLSKILWGDKEIYNEDIVILKDVNSGREQKRVAATHIAENIPAWFKYETIENIAKDICHYFNYYETVPAAI